MATGTMPSTVLSSVAEVVMIRARELAELDVDDPVSRVQEIPYAIDPYFADLATVHDRAGTEKEYLDALINLTAQGLRHLERFLSADNGSDAVPDRSTG